MRRFFLPHFQQPELRADEAHHAIHVLRLKVGDTLTLFDGRGHEAQCRIVETTRDAVRLAILQQSTTPPLLCRITLAQAIPKKNMDLIVQKATELGVAAIVPLVSERTIKRPTGSSRSERGKLDRWREIALEGCKQCGNNWLPEIHAPQKAVEFIGNLSSAPHPNPLSVHGERESCEWRFDLKLVASLQQDSRPLKAVLADSQIRRLPVSSVLILIGPEGDFTPAEIAAAKSAGCLPLSLGPLVLRAETAALYALSILHHELQHGYG